MGVFLRRDEYLVEQTTLTTRIRVGQGLYITLAFLFALFVIAQVFTAGMAIFVGAENWLKHTTLVHILGLNVPILMLITAIIGKMPRWAFWYVLGIASLVFGMYFSANFIRVTPWVGALHPVLALILFIISVSVVIDTWKHIMKK